MSAEELCRVLRIRINQCILRLFGPQFMVVQLLLENDGTVMCHLVSVEACFCAGVFHSNWFRIALIEQSFVIRGEIQSTEFEPLDFIGIVFSRGDIANACVTPI